MIDTSAPFSLYALSEVIYYGRAYSTLEKGNYLIIHKADGSIQIHGATKIPPRNYQGPKSQLRLVDGALLAENKKETIKIIIHEILSLTYLHNWSSEEIVIRETERELVDKLFENWDLYFDEEFAYVFKEYHTKVGDVDLLGVTFDNKMVVVEVKRGKATMANCTQLKRYVESFAEDYVVDGYIASPQINVNAMNYLRKHNYRWIRVDFDSRRQ